MNDPDVYVVIVENLVTKEVLGGERIHIKGKNNIYLPIENAVGVVDTRIYDLILAYTTRGTTAELCGLWNARKIAGQGISTLLTKLGVALAKIIAVDKLFVLCAPHTVKMCQDAGFKIETSIGNNGTFYYPKLDLIATSLIIDDMNALTNASPRNLEEIVQFIQNPESLFQLQTPLDQPVQIKYSLSIKNA
jgi:hypothetical protein